MPNAFITISRQPAPEAEALAVLTSHARGKSGPLAPEALARYVLRITPGGDFDIRMAALEALCRRVESALQKPRLLVRPDGKPGNGRFFVESPDGGRRYSAWLFSLDPVFGSCDCKDFARASLGLCKHLLAALAHVGEAPGHAPRTEELSALPLRWSPLKPLTGPGDWLSRVELRESNADISDLGLRRWFGNAEEGWRPLKENFAADPEHRLELVRALRRAGAAPALSTLLEAEETNLLRAQSDSWSPSAIDQALEGLKLPLYPYQREGVARILTSGRLVLADDMGLGKTAQAIAACHALFTTGKVERGLILTPASLKAQWLREWGLFSDVPVAVLDGPPAARANAFAMKKGFLIANYEQVLRDLPLMQRFLPGIVVLDEAQRIKNWQTRTAELVKQLRPLRRLVLTGTPMENRLGELASLVEWVDDHALEPKWRLGPAHTIAADGPRGVVGAKNLDTLRTRLAPCLLRRTRAEVLGQLPERMDIRLPVPLSPEQVHEHDALDQPINRLLHTARKRPLSQQEFLRLMNLFTRQRMVCNGLAQVRFTEQWPALSQQTATPALLETLGSPKLVELRELISAIAVTQGRKVVVFSQWRRMLELAHWASSDVLADAGARGLFFTGDETQARRARNVVDFHDDPTARVLFATDAGGVGLNLQRAASAVINLDLPWNPAVLEQRVGRVHRLGQQEPVEVHLLVSDGVESRISFVAGDKRALFEGLFDGASDEVRFESAGSFLERAITLVGEVEPEGKSGESHEDEHDAAPEPDVSDTLTEPIGAPLDKLGVNGEPAATPVQTATQVSIDVAALAPALAQATVRPLENGRVALEVPAEAAAALAQLFEGLAKALKPPK
jgi:superfamily II DNA or RNA helicase